MTPTQVSDLNLSTDILEQARQGDDSLVPTTPIVTRHSKKQAPQAPVRQSTRIRQKVDKHGVVPFMINFKYALLCMLFTIIPVCYTLQTELCDCALPRNIGIINLDKFTVSEDPPGRSSSTS